MSILARYKAMYETGYKTVKLTVWQFDKISELILALDKDGLVVRKDLKPEDMSSLKSAATVISSTRPDVKF